MASYDILIVGAGMFGSSTAKHIRKLQPGLRVAIVGPEDNNNAHARGQHHDEARITRRLETHIPWEHMNNDSMIHYREVERESGIDFYTPGGCAWVAPREDKDAMLRCFAALVDPADSERAPIHVDDQVRHCTLGPADASTAGSQIVITTDASVAETALAGEVAMSHLADADKPTYYVTESGPAGGGTVHPNRYVQAQLTIALQTLPTEMYTHVKESVVKVVPKDGAYEVTTEKGTVHRAKKVVVATGYWCRYHQLLPERITSRLIPQTVLIDLIRVRPPHGEDHAANVLASARCPCLVRTAGPRADRVYCLPPRYYEKYKGWFMKMGELEPVESATDVSTCEGAVAWYNGEVPVNHELGAHVATIMQAIYVHWPAETAEQPAPYQNRYTVTCMIDETKEKTPIIDKVDGNGLYSCVGGNGRGAKSCDAIGCITAHRVLDAKLPSTMAHYEGMFYET